MIWKILISVALFPLIYLLIAGVLIISQWPRDLAERSGGLDFSGVLAGDAISAPETRPVTMRDGYPLPVRRYGTPGKGPLVIMIHGSGWHGMQFTGLARALSENADILVPDLRGHGVAPARRGDVEHIGQFEEDLADLITAMRAGEQRVILLGHSSGGGLVVRFAGGPFGDRMDKAVLLAPFLKHDAPTMRPDSGGWTVALTRRLIGLSMLNTVGIRALNHLEVIQFAMPRTVLDGPLGKTATTAYSFRLNSSFAPRMNYLADVVALPPFLLVAGRMDEAFIAEAYEPTLSEVTDRGRYHIVDGVGHLDIVSHPETLAMIRAFMAVE